MAPWVGEELRVGSDGSFFNLMCTCNIHKRGTLERRDGLTVNETPSVRPRILITRIDKQTVYRSRRHHVVSHMTVLYKTPEIITHVPMKALFAFVK